jgi:hypothetical protein
MAGKISDLCGIMALLKKEEGEQSPSPVQRSMSLRLKRWMCANEPWGLAFAGPLAALLEISGFQLKGGWN